MKVSLDVLTESDLRKISSFNLNSTYDLSDPRFGVNADCEICKKSKCEGHYANLNLGTYIIHPLFHRDVMNRVRRICLNCGNNVSIKRPKNYKCKVCNIVIEKELPNIDNMTKEIKDIFELRNFRERHFIIRYILVPPPGVRPKNDVEWPSDLSQKYSLLMDFIKRNDKRRNTAVYRHAISKLYSKIATGGRGSVTDKLISGKEGIFRGIVKGKRLDRSIRSVITGDPLIGINEIMIPKLATDKVLVSETCFEHNAKCLKKEAELGRVFWTDGMDQVESYEIMDGYTYRRFLRDGDYVLFNRQPSLSRDSLMSFRVRIRHDSNLAISMNPIVTSPFNADFDGDEMNVFTSWNLASQAEMESLCNVNMSRSLQPIQDTITGSFILTNNNRVVSHMIYLNCACAIEVVPKTVRRVTGIDLFQLSLPIVMNVSYPVDKNSICKEIPDRILRTTGDYRKVVRFYEHLQVIISIWLSQYGSNISIYDCMLSKKDFAEKRERISRIDLESYDNSKNSFYNWMYRNCSDNYDENPIFRMIKSGSKGNIINMSQIMTSVGHQHIGYEKNSEKNDLVNKGFIKSSYVEGLDSEEFILHLIASRKGVINTGVQTSSTGYLSRRTSMMMSDCFVDYMGVAYENDRIISFPPGVLKDKT